MQVSIACGREWDYDLLTIFRDDISEASKCLTGWSGAQGWVSDAIIKVGKGSGQEKITHDGVTMTVLKLVGNKIVVQITSDAMSEVH